MLCCIDSTIDNDSLEFKFDACSPDPLSKSNVTVIQAEEDTNDRGTLYYCYICAQTIICCRYVMQNLMSINTVHSSLKKIIMSLRKHSGLEMKAIEQKDFGVNSILKVLRIIFQDHRLIIIL